MAEKILFSAALLLALCSQPIRAESGHVLFQRALLMERAAGNLEEASRLYRRIVQESSADRALVARALVQIGRILEKQGSPEARSNYELVAWDYADQPQPAAWARARLAQLGAVATAGTSRSRESETRYTFAFSNEEGTPIGDFSFAPQGDRFVFVGPKPEDPDKGRPQLYLSDSSGSWVRTIVGGEGPWRPRGARWSPDGQYVAYWQAQPEADPPISAIFLVRPDEDRDGDSAWQVGPDIGGRIEDLVWTPDSLNLTFLNSDGFHTLDLKGKATRFIPMPVQGHLPSLGGYSPDGRWLAFQTRPEYLSRPELWITLAAGGETRRISDRTDALARENSSEWVHRPAWAADGRALYYISDLSGSPNVWKVGLDPQVGQRQGESEQVTYFQDATVVHPKMLAGGRMAFSLRRSSSIIQVAGSSATDAARQVVRGLAPQLSPDGRTLYYLAEGPGPGGIYAISRTGGTPRRLTRSQPKADFIFRGFEISPDGRSLAYQIREGDKISLFAVSTGREAQQPRRLVTLDVARNETLEPKWSPDGSLLAFGNASGIYVIPATGGQARKLADLSGAQGWTVRWSPDGQHLALLASAKASGSLGVFVLPASGGEPRRLTPAADNDYKEGLEWHPDGNRLTYMNYGPPEGIWQVHLDGRPATLLIDQPGLWDYVGRWALGGHRFFFVSARSGYGNPWGLYVYDDRTGETTVVWPSDEGSAGFPSFSRDGTTMTWSVTTGVSQLWLMENFR